MIPAIDPQAGALLPQVTGEAFKEAVAINKSLTALLDVIDALCKVSSDVYIYKNPTGVLCSGPTGNPMKWSLLQFVIPLSSPYGYNP